ncbi:enoyl-CoA hydratase/isomerase family protein [Aquisalibacillus elongatus]|uniref:Short chain enoyl-CoA hydratase n=1 Tax=Aquisalibacillus elongatus TaxID=485577 RepID=A0A3N5BAB7_9BACI|nr:enoyl-CoA hydratase-related protein [Aquisalibacillus elongatus]RPF53899.1 short chain enoyl-CoA hydratase [Aquisalibacillus elongatus]
MSKKFIKTYEDGPVGVIELNRPEVLNALNRQMIDEIVAQLEDYQRNSAIRVIMMKGNGKAFAAGADIEEMKNDTPTSMELADPFAVWDRIASIKKPIITAVNGFALGGGFELALHCDLIVASEDAKFGFPEVKLGVMPGAGGTQLLSKAIGQRKALEWIWLGEQMSANEALELGAINRVTSKELVEEETMRLAHQLAEQAPLSLRLIKEAVDVSSDVPLREGMKLERKNFYLLFDSQDQSEGMQAFVEKRPPHFKGE